MQKAVRQICFAHEQMLEDSNYSLSPSLLHTFQLCLYHVSLKKDCPMYTTARHPLQMSMIRKEPKVLSFCPHKHTYCNSLSSINEHSPTAYMLLFIVVESGEGWKLPVLLPLLNRQCVTSPKSVDRLVSLDKQRKHLKQHRGGKWLKKLKLLSQKRVQ